MSRATTARPAPKTPVAQRVTTVARPRRRWARAAVPLGIAAAIGTTWTVLGTADVDRADPAGTASSVVVRHVGAPRATALDGAAGAATLHVVAELRGTGAPEGDTVPMGVPVTLTIETQASDGGTLPSLTAERRTPDDRPVEATAGTTSLARHETFLFDHTDGSFVLRDGAGATAGGLGHTAGASVTRPLPATGGAWAAALGPHAGVVATDPTGRWAAVAQPAAGRVDLIDLVARAGPLAAPVMGRPTALAFAPDGSTLWVATDGSGLVAVDLPGADVRRVAGVGDAHAVAVSDDGALVLVIGTDGQARLVDAATRRVVAVRPASADVVATHVVPTLDGGAFVGVGRGGLVRVLPVHDRTFAADRAIETGPAGGRDIGGALVAPDGRTLLVADRLADEVVVVDLVDGAVVRTVPTGADPTDVVRLGHFAVVRHAGTVGATWIDLDDAARSGPLAVGDTPAASLALAAGGDAVLAPAPVERRIYRIAVVDGRPVTVASDDDPTGADVALDVLGSLHALGPGRYEQRTAFAEPGRYRLTLALGGHRATWDVDVA